MNRFFTLLFAASCLTAVGQYQVGDVGPAGGWIFYVDSLDEFDWDYLEVASSYCPVACNIIGSPQNTGPYEEVTDLNVLRGIGMGEFNTTWAFDNWLHQNSGQSSMGGLNNSARVALMEVFAFRQNDFTDWFMPSIDELSMVFSALSEDITSSFSPDAPYASDGLQVWSSSPRPDNTSYVFGINLSNNAEVFLPVYNATYSNGFGILVLPIRSFSANSGSCGQGTVWDETSQTCVVDNTESLCDLVYDGTGDGFVGAGDLLGLLTEYGAECTPETAFTCGDPVSYQGYDYETVQIGEQCWFAENLRAENYRNGDALPFLGVDSSQLNTLDDSGLGGYTYPNGSEAGASYGLLYNVYSILDNRKLCPAGFHLPTYEDMEVLEEAVLLDVGAFIDDSQWFGSNESGFSAVPAGRFENDFINYGSINFLFCVEMNTNLVGHLQIGENTGIAYGNLQPPNPMFPNGRIFFSVRCLKD